MREEEKRMAVSWLINFKGKSLFQEYFADEDKEMALDEEDKTEDELFETAEDQRRKEREQYMKRWVQSINGVYKFRNLKRSPCIEILK